MFRQHITFVLIPLILVGTIGLLGCSENKPTVPGDQRTVPRNGNWGIYALTLSNGNVRLLYGTDHGLGFLDLNSDGTRLAFMEQVDDTNDVDNEICVVDTGGQGFRRLTDNDVMDVYPVWSPDGTNLAFLTMRDADLDIYLMDTSGSGQTLLYNSGSHDADIDWVDDVMTFTTGSCIWKMKDDGTSQVRLTNPPNAGVQGNSRLPFGDYDPRISPNEAWIVFERLEYDSTIHGNYNLFLVDSSGSTEQRLTSTNYSQGLCNWSNSGTTIVYVLGAVGMEGRYDLYTINPNGTNNRNITPAYFPPDFICNNPVYSKDDTKVYFIGWWWVGP